MNLRMGTFRKTLGSVVAVGALAALGLQVSLPAEASSSAAPATATAGAKGIVHGWHIGELPASGHQLAPRAVSPDAVCSAPNVMYNNNSNKVLEVYHSSTANGAVVDQYSYNGSNTQKWCFYYEGTWSGLPYFKIVNDNSGKCLDDSGFNTYNGAKIDQWSCNGGGNQEWAEFTISQIGNVFAPLTEANTNIGLGYVLEVYHSSTANGAKVDLWSSNGSNTQAWCPEPC